MLEELLENRYCELRRSLEVVVVRGNSEIVDQGINDCVGQGERVTCLSRIEIRVLPDFSDKHVFEKRRKIVSALVENSGTRVASNNRFNKTEKVSSRSPCLYPIDEKMGVMFFKNVNPFLL